MSQPRADVGQLTLPMRMKRKADSEEPSTPRSKKGTRDPLVIPATRRRSHHSIKRRHRSAVPEAVLRINAADSNDAANSTSRTESDSTQDNALAFKAKVQELTFELRELDKKAVYVGSLIAALRRPMEKICSPKIHEPLEINSHDSSASTDSITFGDGNASLLRNKSASNAPCDHFRVSELTSVLASLSSTRDEPLSSKEHDCD
jgi:hypothetical protein